MPFGILKFSNGIHTRNSAKETLQHWLPESSWPGESSCNAINSEFCFWTPVWKPCSQNKRDSSCSLLTLHTAQTATQRVLPEHQRPFLVRWGCPVRLWNLYPWENSKLSGHGPWHLALGGSIWAGPIGQGDLHSPFHPQPFCDSFFSYTGKPRKKISHISCRELPYC